MTNTPEHISINLGDGHTTTPIPAKISITTEIPLNVGAGCTAYLFENGHHKHTDILFSVPSENPGEAAIVERVRSHSDLSPLDLVCVEAIKIHFGNNPPNEVYCRLEKLDPVAIKNLSVVAPPPDMTDVTPPAEDNEDE